MPTSGSLRVYTVVDRPPTDLWIELVEEIPNVSPTMLWQRGESLTVYPRNGNQSAQYVIDIVLPPTLRGESHLVQRVVAHPLKQLER